MVLNKKINQLIINIDKLSNKIKNKLDYLSISYTESDSLRKLISLIPHKTLSPINLSNVLYGHTAINLYGDNVLITGGAESYNTVLNNNYIFNCRSGASISKLNLDYGHLRHIAIKIDDNNILINGGIKEGESGVRITKNQIYNLQSNTYTNKTNMETSKERHTGNLINNIVYIVGGVAGNNKGAINDWHLAYNINSNSFSRKAGYAIAGQTSINHQNQVFYFGGQVNEYSEVRNFVKSYNVNNNSFTNKSDLPTARSCLASIAGLNDHVMLLGGYLRLHPKTDKNEVYKISSNTFTNKRVMPDPCSDHSISYIGSGGIIIGGKGSNNSNEEAGTPLNKVIYYNYYDDIFYQGR